RRRNHGRGIRLGIHRRASRRDRRRQLDGSRRPLQGRRLRRRQQRQVHLQVQRRRRPARRNPQIPERRRKGNPRNGRGHGARRAGDAVRLPGQSHDPEVQTEVAKPRPGFALDSEGNFYAGAEASEGSSARERWAEEERTELAVVSKLGASGKILNPELDNENSTAVAVDVADNSVYVDNTTTVAGKPRNTVGVFSAGGALIQRLSAPGLTEGDGVAVNPLDGSVYVADAASNKVYLFALEGPGQPAIEATSAESLAPKPPATNATQLNATIDPSGADTHYYFEYGVGTCATPSACTKTTAVDIGTGFGDQQASVEVQSLPPGSYHYRVVAENQFGTVTSSEQTFTILALLSGLPDGRGWEMVSPSEKDGAEPEAITKEGGVIQASEDGHSISFVADGPMPAKDEPEGSRSPELTQ